MEFEIKTDFEAFPKVIEYNHEELKQQITEQLEKYQNMVITENDIAKTKADRARLNKFKDAVNAKRIEVKKEYLKPYQAFEEQVKEIIAIVDEPIKAIDVQIKFFEDNKRQEKKEQIEALYLDEIGEIKELIPLAKIWNPKWINATYKLSDIAIEIETAIGRVKSGLQIIKDLHCTFEQQVMDKFINTLDINAALMENKRLEEQEKKLNAVMKQEESKPALQQESRQSAVVDYGRKALQDNPQQTDIKETGQNLITLDFRVFVTAEQAMLLKSFLMENGISYGKVPQVV